MKFLLLESEVIAREIAWQLRTQHLGKLVVVPRPDMEAIKLAISLAGGKTVKCWRLIDLVAIASILSLVFLNIIGQIDNSQELRRETLEVNSFANDHCFNNSEFKLKENCSKSDNRLINLNDNFDN